MTKELFIAGALKWLGTPYKWGGDDPSGIDCSGLVQELLATMGLDLPGDQNADGLYRYFLKHGTIDVKDTGSLVFFGNPGHVTHIAVLLDPVTMIEAGGGGSHTLTTQDAWAQNAFVKLRPYTRRQDVVAVIRPSGLPF